MEEAAGELKGTPEQRNAEEIPVRDSWHLITSLEIGKIQDHMRVVREKLPEEHREEVTGILAVIDTVLRRRA